MSRANVEMLKRGYEALTKATSRSCSDSLHLIRQLGPWRLLLLGVAWLRRGRLAYRA
jgi:hypothetical protein